MRGCGLLNLTRGGLSSELVGSRPEWREAERHVVENIGEYFTEL
jgi:hypothetical protein